ncbi:hypothetical protein [Streptomyces sp. NPDC053367]|uniref:hypothetical protein n=1 Tax=Streptomyces sp. NPDC053367 TaxID=3365700 RepID=UPI0037D30E32
MERLTAQVIDEDTVLDDLAAATAAIVFEHNRLTDEAAGIQLRYGPDGRRHPYRAPYAIWQPVAGTSHDAAPGRIAPHAVLSPEGRLSTAACLRWLRMSSMSPPAPVSCGKHEVGDGSTQLIGPRPHLRIHSHVPRRNDGRPSTTPDGGRNGPTQRP